jgi:hypothetical protein
MILRLRCGFPALEEQGADLAPPGADLADTGASSEGMGASIGPHGIAIRCGAQALCRRAQGLRRRAQTLWTWAQASDMRRKLCAARLGACEFFIIGCLYRRDGNFRAFRVDDELLPCHVGQHIQTLHHHSVGLRRAWFRELEPTAMIGVKQEPYAGGRGRGDKTRFQPNLPAILILAKTPSFRQGMPESSHKDVKPHVYDRLAVARSLPSLGAGFRHP